MNVTVKQEFYSINLCSIKLADGLYAYGKLFNAVLSSNASVGV